jgi:tRNA (guanine37-N1)-methyltransferase
MNYNILMKIDILTLFPDMFAGPFDTSMLKKAKDKRFVEINIHYLRNWAKDKHKTVDDRPFGGGKGMVIRVDVVNNALKELKSKKQKKQLRTILLSPQGKTFNQKKALELSKLDNLILIAGHYEGFDERIREHLVDEEISIGDYVLTGGEIPAMVLVDSVVRLLPGVLEPEATINESFSLAKNDQLASTLLDYPQYTRPENFEGWKVPEVLLSGNHKNIEKYRFGKAEELTKKYRPDLIAKPQ